MTVVISVVVLLLLIGAFRLWRIAVRLDRLHLRTQAAWATLDAALSRRALAARAIAAAGHLDPDLTVDLRTAARNADSGERGQRADAENDLTRVLERLPVAIEVELAAELTDAAERVILARRFYNDAVRDTRALRDQWITRMFRLAGTAALPTFFEIAEYQPVQPELRVSARVLLLDPQNRVLLFQGTDPAAPTARWWFTPGGGVENGEDLRQAACREVSEETALQLPEQQLVGPVWWRRQRFAFNGTEFESVEHYFLARLSLGTEVADIPISTVGFTELERATVLDHRWWSIEDLQETSETVYPVELAARLDSAILLLDRGAEPESLQIR